MAALCTLHPHDDVSDQKPGRGRRRQEPTVLLLLYYCLYYKRTRGKYSNNTPLYRCVARLAIRAQGRGRGLGGERVLFSVSMNQGATFVVVDCPNRRASEYHTGQSYVSHCRCTVYPKSVVASIAFTLCPSRRGAPPAVRVPHRGLDKDKNSRPTTTTRFPPPHPHPLYVHSSSSRVSDGWMGWYGPPPSR